MPPTIVNGPKTFYEPLETSTFSLPCEIVSVVPANITWFKDNSAVLSTDPRFKIEGDGSLNFLSIKHGVDNHDGKYYCMVSNTFGSVQSNKGEVITVCKFFFTMFFSSKSFKWFKF